MKHLCDSTEGSDGVLDSPEDVGPAQSSGAEAQHEREQHRSRHCSCELLLRSCSGPDIPAVPERGAAAARLVSVRGSGPLPVLAHVELVRPQCGSACVLQEAVVQAAVESAAVGDHQAPVAVHKHGVQFTSQTLALELSKGGVPILHHTCTRGEEELKVELQSWRCVVISVLMVTAGT